MELVSTEQAAERLGVSSVTLRRWRRQGLVPTPRYPGGKYTPEQLAKMTGPTPKELSK